MKINFIYLMTFFSTALIFMTSLNIAISQVFINGNFENNNLSACEFNLSDVDFNKKMANVYAFGKSYINLKYQGEVDIHKRGCYVNPYSGNWCIGLGSDYLTYKTSDAVALELSSALITGNRYKLSFYIFGNTRFTDSIGYLLIGESILNSTFGIGIDTIYPIAEAWKEINLEFTAQQNSNFICVKNEVGIKAWNQIDSFAISEITETKEYEKNEFDFTLYPNPTENEISITFNDPINFRFAKVCNLYGECILISESCHMNIAELPLGYYIVYIFTDKWVASRRIIKH